ncbi:MAG TPA: DUF2141 domain-containing protein [Candidatus Omnitrophota bacterium]|nr:DUF2141 domain-containing protein [Candidatus Omnitrophota bacterium]
MRQDLRLYLSAFLSLLFVFATPCLLQAHPHNGRLKIVITGFASDQGVVKIGLVSTKEAFEARRSVKEGYTGVTVDIKDGKIEYVFEGIPYGEYAIKYYHDENGNDRLDANFLGIPKERYGFSNNARALLGPPSFERAKFIFKDDDMVHAMKIAEGDS